MTATDHMECKKVVPSNKKKQVIYEWSVVKTEQSLLLEHEDVHLELRSKHIKGSK